MSRAPVGPAVGLEVTRAYPAYARLLDGPYEQGIRVGVEQSISVFVDQVAEPAAPSALRDEMRRRFGRFEVYEGRSELIDTGVIDDAPVVLCQDHLITLWLLSDPVLLDQLARRELAPIAEISANRRERLIETLRIWLETRGTAAQLGELLDVHTQTVRYRMRNLETIFDEQLVDPESRFSTEAVLRAMQLRTRSDDAPL
ncbi:helix-turn-helix domain-containing protein [Streptomyces sp. NBC_01320]|uniref:PucR family transcriptional regulator n=1 Tax=Streptomyces sp. NBC_01320 TaxID=2903824 RepID=UPI002E0FB337|nr:helix-turn-helix domain-containing protein [Streptomyces sp. NBC_01320]